MPFAILGLLLGAVVLALACLDDHVVRRPAYALIGAGICGFLHAANWSGEELCVRHDCQPERKGKFGLGAASVLLLALGLVWFDFLP